MSWDIGTSLSLNLNGNRWLAAYVSILIIHAVYRGKAGCYAALQNSCSRALNNRNSINESKTRLRLRMELSWETAGLVCMRPWMPSLTPHKLGMMAYSCGSRTWEVDEDWKFKVNFD